MSDVIGIPWCREEEYDAFRAILEDPNNLPPTWAEFAKAAQEAERHYEERGATVERVEIDPRGLPEWCAEHGHRVNAGAQYRFADWVAKRRQRDGSNPPHS